MASKDQEIASVVGELDTLMDLLRSSVDALHTILLTPPPDPDAAGKELTPS